MSEIAREKDADNDGFQIIQYFVGPLNLDKQTKRATTVMGAELSLDADEFEALAILSSHEDEPLAFELLYAAIWDAEDKSCELEAREKLGNLLKQVRNAGEGFMWIEYEPETGFTFRTRWGHNWQARKNSAYSNDLPISRIESEKLFKRINTLTPAEMTVFRHMINGREYRATAAQMYVTVNTVRSHVKSIMPKLGVHTRDEFMIYAGLLEKNGLEEDILCPVM